MRTSAHGRMLPLACMRPLTTDMRDGARRPYFSWDEDVSIDELRSILIEGWREDGILAS